MGRLATAVLVVLACATSAWAISIDSAWSGTGTTSLSWSHDVNSVVEGVITFCVVQGTDTDVISGATYGGTAMTFVGRAADTTTEPGSVEAYFLGASVPTADPATVVCTVSSGANNKFGSSIAITATTDLELEGTTGFCVAEENQANPSCDVTGISGVSWGAMALYSGRNDVTGVNSITGWTDRNNQSWGSAHAESANLDTEQSSGDLTCGWTHSGGPDDVAMVCVAVQEVAAAGARRIFIID